MFNITAIVSYSNCFNSEMVIKYKPVTPYVVNIEPEI